MEKIIETVKHKTGFMMKINHDTNTNEQDLETFNHNMFFIISLATAFDNQRPVTTNPDEWQNSNKYSVDWINLYQKDDGVHFIDWKYAK